MLHLLLTLVLRVLPLGLRVLVHLWLPRQKSAHLLKTVTVLTHRMSSLELHVDKDHHAISSHCTCVAGAATAEPGSSDSYATLKNPVTRFSSSSDIDRSFHSFLTHKSCKSER